MFADDHGVRPLNSEALERFGIHPEADYDVTAFLARNMGVITIVRQGDGLQVLARASNCLTRAIEHAAAYLALRNEPTRIGVWWSNSWLRERNPDGAIAAARLRQLTQLDQPSAPLPVYEGQRVGIDQVSAMELAPFQPLLSLFGRRLDNGAIGHLFSLGIGDRMTIAEASSEGPRIVFFPYGPDYYGRDWALQAVGRVIRNQPDKEYGLAVERRYTEALSDNVIHFERVRATIKESGERPGSESRRSSYSRLIVPFTEGRRRVVASYSVLTRQPGTVG